MSRNIDIVDEVMDEANFIAGVAYVVEERCSPDNDNPNEAPTDQISCLMHRVVRSAENIHELVDELHKLNQQKPDADQSKEGEQ